MGTCGVVGQAVGSAAVVATRHGVLPREVGQKYIGEVQSILMEDDCWLPHIRRPIAPLTANAKVSVGYGDGSALLNGLDRRVWGSDNGYYGMCDRPITVTFDEKKHVDSFRLVVDSDLDREYIEGNPNLMTIPMPLFFARSYNNTSFGFPTCLLKAFRVEYLDDAGNWVTGYETDSNYMRLIRATLNVDTTAVRLIPLATWGSAELYHTYGSVQAHIFAFEVR